MQTNHSVFSDLVFMWLFKLDRKRETTSWETSRWSTDLPLPKNRLKTKHGKPNEAPREYKGRYDPRLLSKSQPPLRDSSGRYRLTCCRHRPHALRSTNFHVPSSQQPHEVDSILLFFFFVLKVRELKCKEVVLSKTAQLLRETDGIQTGSSESKHHVFSTTASLISPEEDISSG